MKEHISNMELRQRLERFGRSTYYYRFSDIASCYSEGVDFLADTIGCHWLVADASTIGCSLMGKTDRVDVEFVRASDVERKRTGFDATVSYTDKNGKLLQRQSYLSADFPFDRFKLIYVHRILMLPSEY